MNYKRDKISENILSWAKRIQDYLQKWAYWSPHVDLI